MLQHFNNPLFMPKNKLSLIAVLIIVGSSNPVAIKFAMNEGWPPFALGMLRMSVIGVFFVLWLVARGEGLVGPTREARYYAAIAAACKAVGVVLFYIALSMIPASRSVFISTMSPIVSLVLIHFILEHEHVRMRHVLGILTSLVGVVLLLGLRDETSAVPLAIDETGQLFLMGDLLMILSVIFNNAMVVFEKKAILSGASPGHLLISTDIFSVLVFTIFFASAGESLDAIPLSGAALGIFLYLVTVVGIFLFYYRRWLVSKLELTYISSFSHVGKVVSILYAVLFLGESISAISILCFAIILTGTVIATRGKV